MRHGRLGDMFGGWFVGDFDPTLLRSSDFEVGVKRWRAGEREAKHYHNVATEVTAVISGSVQMMGRRWEEGDIIVVEPGEATDFEALTDAVTVAVKSPSAPDDKFLSADSL